MITELFNQPRIPGSESSDLPPGNRYSLPRTAVLCVSRALQWVHHCSGSRPACACAHMGWLDWATPRRADSLLFHVCACCWSFHRKIVPGIVNNPELSVWKYTEPRPQITSNGLDPWIETGNEQSVPRCSVISFQKVWVGCMDSPHINYLRQAHPSWFNPWELPCGPCHSWVCCAAASLWICVARGSQTWYIDVSKSYDNGELIGFPQPGGSYSGVNQTVSMNFFLRKGECIWEFYWAAFFVQFLVYVENGGCGGGDM